MDDHLKLNVPEKSVLSAHPNHQLKLHCSCNYKFYLNLLFQVEEVPKVELNHTNSGDSNHKKMEYKHVDSLQP